MIGLYRPGSSPLHRAPAGLKLFGLLVVVTVIVLLQSPWQLAVAAVLVAAGFAVARIPARVAVAQLWPMRWLLLVTAVFQVVFTGPERAVMVCGTLLLTVAAAALVTLTTRVTAMLDLCRRLLHPLRRWVDADRVGLLLALTIRCVPLLATVVSEVSAARKARGQSFSLRAIAAPVVVRALRTADEMGAALMARGVDD
ncbi:energy-coupling factor transporter transmembrane protein EcfT [Nakamurella flava]|uniref:Energy-coupling factor transporter transmembrane protein EcfT n=1 Tax=Nakamurella flava TaxID=2576308 RepID=A0A4U6QN41_9ACTN|nr:energy-coupling factor transporter transmembrane protein EcfT [Nakamurella flava]TKV61819.1 energy-coupling factor transporter transmembrane protein EcfT [Nakamurella flava]